MSACRFWRRVTSGNPFIKKYDKELNYDDLASGLKAALENDPSVFDADRLQKYTGPELRELLKWPRQLPLEDERVRLMHEVGFELERSFGGKASNIVDSCEKLAVKLVTIIASHFPDYIVPAALQQLGVLSYSLILANRIESSKEIGSGSDEEVELRACSIYAVEKMRDLIRKRTGKQLQVSFLFGIIPLCAAWLYSGLKTAASLKITKEPNFSYD